MTFPEWLTLVESSGVPVNGVDMNWLQMQYQNNQQPSFVAQMIMTGNAPRPMMQSMYQQPMYQQPPAKPRGSGLGTFMNVFIGILGFAVIVGMILYGLSMLSKQYEAKNGGKKLTIEGGDSIDNFVQPPAEELKRKGLDPTLPYPYWPLVYDMAMTAAPDVIFGKVTNYGDKAVKNVTIRFGLYTKNNDKVGMAEDHIASLEPGATWDYRAKVSNNYDQCKIDDITFSK